ncbi:MAG: glycosyltransferase family 39 protein [Candidatus Rokubacteria bacterium]|nr:glycosyltransferase family 39 protein [Candidatus Rokubacteria bacterium]
MSRAAARRFLLVFAASALLVATDLGGRILSNNDEARFAVLAQDMLARGDWLYPRLNGDLYLNKPVLLAWLIALVSWPLGHVTQLSAALPSAAAGLATACALYGLGRELFGAHAGTLAALIAVTTQGLFLHARLPMPDMLMTACIAAAVWMLWRALRHPAGRDWLGFYAFTAAAFWAKGPAGFLPLGVALAWAAAHARTDVWRRLRLAPGLALVAVLVAPWWLLGLAADSEAVRRVVVTDHLGWYAPRAPTLASLVAPLQNAVVVLVPWVVFLPPALTLAWRFLRGQGEERDGVLFVLVWAAVVFALVAVAREQRLRYYLPLVAPASLLVGWWWSGAIVRQRRTGPVPWRLYAAGGLALLAVTAAVVAFRVRWLRDARLALPASVTEALLLAAGLVLFLGALAYSVRRPERRRAFVAAWAGAAVLLAGGYHWKLPRRNSVYDYPRVTTGPVLAQAPAVVTLGLHELPLSFYLGRPVALAQTEDDLRQALDRTAGAVAVVPDAALARLQRENDLVVVARTRLAFRPVSVVTRPAASGGGGGR